MVVADQLAERWIPKPECMLLLNSILHLPSWGHMLSLCVYTESTLEVGNYPDWPREYTIETER